MVVERAWGYSYERPARHMREYLDALMPALHDGAVDVQGDVITARAQLTIPGAVAPTVLLAALQPRMLDLAGRLADGTITWCTGPVVLERQIIPLVTAAAADADRPAPRIVVALPTIVTDDDGDGRMKAGEQLQGYGDLPVYRAVLDQEGADGPADVSVVGDERSVAGQLARFEAIGATDFVAIPTGTDADRTRTLAHLASLVG
jgi:F420-dependent oxidoreductase-like protein